MIPLHWALRGPKRAQPAAPLLRIVNVRGAHVATFRRLLRIGPYGVIVLRYRPGRVEEPSMREPTP